MLCRHLLPLPVHAGSLAVVNLHPVHADIALARSRVARMHARQSDEPSPVMRPALQNRKCIQVESLALNHFLARRIFRLHLLRKGRRQRAELRQHLQLVQQPALGRLHLHQPRDPFRNLIEPVHSERHRHAPLAAKLVHQHRLPGKPLHLFKQQRRPARSILPLNDGCPTKPLPLRLGWE